MKKFYCNKLTIINKPNFFLSLNAAISIGSRYSIEELEKLKSFYVNLRFLLITKNLPKKLQK